MPKQHVLLGRRLPRVGARRISFLLVCFSIFALISLLFTLPSTIPANSNLHKYTDHIPKIPKVPTIKNPFANSALNPFKQPAHPPPRQKNDTYEESSWWADWKWLHVPFSSSLTLDEDRSLLPPLKERPPIYCYYDVTLKKDEASKDAESDLLLTWRRAWWAQGFRPIILSAAEAMNNPRYQELQRRPDVNEGLKTDLMRWLAWESMGGGLLAYHTTLPMGPREDPLLSSFRRGEYPKLTRWADLNDGLFAGTKLDIEAAIKETLASDQLADANDFIGAAPEALFQIDDKPQAIAYYDADAIGGKYAKVADAITDDRAKGLKSLNRLINSHLHTIWQNIFSEGIAVLKPLPQYSTHMVTDAWQLAQDLSACSKTPMLASCPPNNPKCKPCNPERPIDIDTPARYHNGTGIFTIGTVPHPYTTALLSQHGDDIGVAWIRRESARDAWLAAATSSLLGDAVGSAPRILRFKEAVAGDFATAHSLWLTAEKNLLEEQLWAQLDWHFGFAIPHPADRGDMPQRPKQGHDPKEDGPPASEEELEAEPGLLKKAKELVNSRKGGKDRAVVVRAATEAWNLADTEAWKFARSFLARRIVERQEWEREESRYVGGSGSESGRRKGWGSQWADDDEDEPAPAPPPAPPRKAKEANKAKGSPKSNAVRKGRNRKVGKGKNEKNGG